MDQRFRRYRSDWDLKRCGIYDSAGGYRSQWYQGFCDGMEWHRLSLSGLSDAQVQVYATDQPPDIWDGTLVPVMERQASDLSLYGVKGRFLCFTVTPADALTSYTLTFPGRSIDSALPLILRDDATLRQFLAVYQSAYMNTNQQAACFPGRLDPYAEDSVPELKLWLGAMRWMHDAPCEEALLREAPRLNRMRGTRNGLARLLEIVTGGRGELVEDFQWKNQPLSASEQEDCARLYGNEHASVSLLLPANTSTATYRFLKDVLEDFIPLGVSYSILQIHEGTAMDGHSYLDMNAELSDPPQAVMDGSDLDDLILE